MSLCENINLNRNSTKDYCLTIEKDISYDIKYFETLSLLSLKSY